MVSTSAYTPGMSTPPKLVVRTSPPVGDVQRAGGVTAQVDGREDGLEGEDVVAVAQTGLAIAARRRDADAVAARGRLL